MNNISKFSAKMLSKYKDKGFISVIASAVFVLSVIFFMGSLPELPNLFRAISNFFSDIANISNFFEKVCDRIDNATSIYNQRSDNLMKSIEESENSRKIAFKKWGDFFYGFFSLAITCVYSCLDGLGCLIQTLLTFASKNSLFASLVLVCVLAIVSGVLSFALIFTGKSVGFVSLFVKILLTFHSFFSVGGASHIYSSTFGKWFKKKKGINQTTKIKKIRGKMVKVKLDHPY